jgi:hypothetical protein
VGLHPAGATGGRQLKPILPVWRNLHVTGTGRGRRSPARQALARSARRRVGQVAELVVGGALLFAALVFLGVIGFVVSLVFTLVLLPFNLLGFLLKGVFALLLLPFMLVLGLVVALVFGAGMIAFLAPALPLVLLGFGIWWLVKRRQQPAAPAH